MNPTQSDTPRTDAMESCVKQYAIPQFELLLHARALEIETQELAEALRDVADSPNTIISEALYHQIDILLARHRAKQEAPR